MTNQAAGPAATPVPPVGPGQAAWLKSVELWGPGHAATWYDLSDDERKQWSLIATAGIAGSEYVRGLKAIASGRASDPDHQVQFAAEGSAYDGLRKLAEDGNLEARDMLAAIAEGEAR